ncbi:glycosyltransferase [uncultured Alistipes sp.]|uniref:glycosyltransferase n=1 Tax=uncultured Alistipes sp. TaxID=538949 RepID=UPI00262A56C8|nr:glycosyltransferase [uncultured Alistipes sp.]
MSETNHPRFTLICCSIDPAAAESLRRNVAATIGEPFEFVAWDNRSGGAGLCEVYNSCALRAKGDFLCFVHEDIRFLTDGWGESLARKLSEPDCGVIGFAGSVLKLDRLTTWLQGVGDMRANYVQHLGARRHLHAKNPDAEDFAAVVTLDGMCLALRRDVWRAVRFDAETFPRFHCYDLDFTTAVTVSGFRNYVCNTVLIEHFSTGAYSYEWLETLKTYHRKWHGRLPLSVVRLDAKRLASLDRRAEAYFLKLLCQKRLFAACGIRDIFRYIRKYPGCPSSWMLPAKYLKYRLKSLVKHG